MFSWARKAVTPLPVTGPVPDGPPAQESVYDTHALVRRFSDLPIFKGFPEEHLGAVVGFSKVHYAYVGQTIIEEGETGRDLYVVLQGRVSVRIESIAPRVDVSINALGPGEVLGEWALLAGEPRSATVSAMIPTHYARIDTTALLAWCDKNPQAGMTLMRNIALILGERLQDTNRRLFKITRRRAF